jgi:amino acid permease
VLVVYLIVAFLGAVTFGTDVQGKILDNLNANKEEFVNPTNLKKIGGDFLNLDQFLFHVSVRAIFPNAVFQLP